MKSNESFSQLELFQDLDEYNSGVFEQAKRVKELVQESYSTFEFEFPEDFVENTFWVFDFDISITQLSKRPEPSSPKLFIRKYIPKLNLYSNDNYLIPCYTQTFDEKIVPNWINEIYVGNNISQDFFYEIAKQYLLLETVDIFFKNKDLPTYLNEKINNPQYLFEKSTTFVVHINSKIFERSKPSPTNPYISSALNKINNISRRLQNQNEYLLIGNYLNYIFENELISDLDKYRKIEYTGKISEYFQNDFLLLNNMEFLTEKPFTLDWGKIILPTSILLKDRAKLKLMDIHNLPNSFFMFQKAITDGSFYKNEIYIPVKFKDELSFKNILKISNLFLIKNKFELNKS